MITFRAARVGRCGRLGLVAAILLLVESSLPTCAAPTSLSLRTWQIDDGSNNLISGIAQTPDGYLWISTSAGLNKFDGTHFEHHALGDRLGVADSNIRLLLTSRSGGLWLAMDGSVLLLNRNKPPWVTHKNIPPFRADSMVEDNDGSLWVGYHAGPICRVMDGKVSTLEADADVLNRATRSLAVDDSGELWLAAGENIGVIRQGRFSLVAQASTTANIARASGGGVWVCSGLTLDKCTDAGGLKVVASLPLKTPAGGPMRPFEDSHGTLWIGTSNAGLFRFDGSDFENVPTPQARITCFEEDKEGNLWVGSDYGLDRVSPRAIELEGAEAGIPLGAVNSVCQAADGSIWAAMANGSLMLRTDGQWEPAPFEFQGEANSLAAGDDGSIWIGTRNRALYRWRGGQLASWDAAKGLAGTSIKAMFMAKNQDLWIGYIEPDGLQCLRNGRLIDIKIPTTDRPVAAIVEDHTNNIWIGFVGRAELLRISNDQVNDETDLIGNRPINSMYVAPDNSLWLGFRSRGLGRLKDGKFSVITSQQGLFEDHIAQIIPDDHGWLWLSSDHGIFKIRLQELNDAADGKIAHVQSVRFGGDEGLPPLQAKTGVFPSAMRSRDGRLWMSMATGLAVIHPERVREQPLPPQVDVQRVLIDDKLVAVSGDYFGENPAGVGELTDAALKLPPDYHRLEFDFAAPAFTEPENERFRYRLDGLDVDWSEPTDQRKVIYLRLPAGNYHFQVAACNADEIWNDHPTELAIGVAPFIWQAWWFRILAVAAFSAVLLGLARYVSFRRLRRQLRVLEQRSVLDRERARIARDIHDDLGHGLTQIVLLSDLAVHDHALAQGIEGRLQQIVSTARQGIRSLDETVWAINPRNDTLADLIDYIGHFVMQSLRAADIKCRLELPDNPPDRMIPSEIRHSLFLVVKEAVNNVIRHAHASKVTLTITIADEVLSMIIVDDGCGFFFKESEPGQDGLINMSQRVRDIGGEFHLESIPGAGTRISLNHVLQPSNGIPA